VADRKASIGFVDKLCKWPDGRMATLDINKTIYTVANEHFIFADRDAFEHYTLRMRWKFFAFLGHLLLFILSTLFRVQFTWKVGTVVAFIFVCILNHIRLYVTWGMQNSLPGITRVWLRLEYECRRGNERSSHLFDSKGIFQNISFNSSWKAPFLASWWLATRKGVPICILPDPADMSGLESRSWSETVALIDEWTRFRSPHKRQRRRKSSFIMTMNNGDESITPLLDSSPIGSHVVGGEIVYVFLGHLYKFDGYRGKVSTTAPFRATLCVEINSVVVV